MILELIKLKREWHIGNGVDDFSKEIVEIIVVIVDCCSSQSIKSKKNL